MGYDTVSWQVHGRVSRHNSHRDAVDNTAWNALTEELAAICEKPEYAEVVSFSDGATDLDELTYRNPVM